MSKFRKYFQLTKVDEAQRIVYGLVTAERLDKDGEICEYASTKAEYQAINAEMSKASEGMNILPLREMHGRNAVGAGKSIDFNDQRREIRMAFKVVDDSTWNKVLEKVLLGFSQGGRYVKRWLKDGQRYYTASPGEVSLVDNPCLSGAMIEYVKADGTIEEYETPSLAALSQEDVDRLAKAVADSLASEGFEAVLNKLAGLLKDAPATELSTQLEKISSVTAPLMRQLSAAKGDKMTPEQITKCAAALGISEEEFKKLHLGENAVEEAKKVLKAEADKKAADEAAELAKKAKEKADAEAAAGKEFVKASDLEAIVTKAVKSATDELSKAFDEKLSKIPVPVGTGSGARLMLVDRDGKELRKADQGSNPLPV